MKMNVRRFASFVLALVLVVSFTVSLAVPAFADSRSETIISRDKAFGRWSKMEDITVKSGSGFRYWAGWRKTTVTIRNTGRQTLTLYGYIPACNGLVYKGQIYPGQSKSLTLSGSGKTYWYTVQGGSYRNGNYGSFRVTTNAGSVW